MHSNKEQVMREAVTTDRPQVILSAGEGLVEIFDAWLERVLQQQLHLDAQGIALQFTKIAIVPGGLSAVIFGIALALQQGYDILHTLWLLLSLLLFIYATLMGIAYFTPKDRRILRICQEEQAKNQSGEMSHSLLHRPHILALRLINVLAVLALILLMIVKPPVFLP